MKHSIRYNKKIIKKHLYKINILREYFMYICSFNPEREYSEHYDTKGGGWKGYYIGFNRINSTMTDYHYVIPFFDLKHKRVVTLDDIPRYFEYTYDDSIYSKKLYKNFKNYYKRKSILTNIKNKYLTQKKINT